MAIDNLNFRGRGNATGGRFAPKHVREILNSQFKDMNLSLEAKNHFARELGTGRTIGSRDFDEAVNSAHKKGLISSDKAEKIKDIVKIPDNFNDHWK